MKLLLLDAVGEKGLTRSAFNLSLSSKYCRSGEVGLSTKCSSSISSLVKVQERLRGGAVGLTCFPLLFFDLEESLSLEELSSGCFLVTEGLFLLDFLLSVWLAMLAVCLMNKRSNGR